MKFGNAGRKTGAPNMGQEGVPGPAEYSHNRMFDHKQMVKYKPFGGLHLSATGFARRDTMFSDTGNGLATVTNDYRKPNGKQISVTPYGNDRANSNLRNGAAYTSERSASQ